ncbi:MAG: RimK/LysX family protein [Balneolaceae bacterium]|nr:RimK/LysX family protein [Balneolaceae bacterium]
MPDDLDTIGRLEHINFPEWDIFEINAKIDTGAYTSSLHCHHIERFEKEGKDYVRFNLLDPSHETYNDRLFELPVYKVKSVKSSNGEAEERIIIEALIELMNKRIKAELSLTDRSEMRHPVLIGRKLIKNQFLVDVSKKYISQKKQ